MSTKPRVYLAHPTKSRFYVRKVIQPVLETAGYEVVNPFLDNGRTKLFFSIEDTNEAVRKEMSDHTPEEIVFYEKNLINECDALVAFIPYESVGTSMELHYASQVFKHTFALVVSEEEYLRIHPWIGAHSTVVTKATDLVKVMNSELRNEGQR